VTYQRYVYPDSDESLETKVLIEIQQALSWQCPIPWSTTRRLFRERNDPNIGQMIHGVLQLLSNSVSGMDATSSGHIMEELRQYATKSTWKFVQHHQNTTLSMPTWNFPGVTKARAGFWRCTGEDDAHYMDITVGGVSLDIFKKYYNPRVVQCVRHHVLKTAMALLMNPDSRHNVNYTTLHLKIRDGVHMHTFSVQPMHTPDSCVVSSISFDQDVDLENNSNAGIIVLPNNMDNIRTVRQDKLETHPPEVYMARGAYKGVKLNEQELSYIHTKQCHTTLSPDHKVWDPSEGSSELSFTKPRNARIDSEKLPLAKVVRISKGPWDVIASSHLITPDKMKTIITVVSYPPFGTQLNIQKTYSQATRPPIPARGSDWNQQATEPTPQVLYHSHDPHRGYQHQQPGKAASDKYVTINSNFFLRGFFLGQLDKDDHLLHVKWRTGIDKDEKNIALAELQGNFTQTKKDISRRVRSIIDGGDGADRQEEFKRLLKADGNGTFFGFLKDNRLHQEYIDKWTFNIQDLVTKYQTQENDSEEENALFSQIPFVFTTLDTEDKELFLETIFPGDPNSIRRDAYSQLMGDTDEFDEVEIQENEEPQRGYMVRRSGGRGGGGGGRGRGGYRGG